MSRSLGSEMGKRVLDVGAASGSEEAEPAVVTLAAAQPVGGALEQPLRRLGAGAVGAPRELRVLPPRDPAERREAGGEVVHVRQLRAGSRDRAEPVADLVEQDRDPDQDRAAQVGLVAAAGAQ